MNQVGRRGRWRRFPGGTDRDLAHVAGGLGWRGGPAGGSHLDEVLLAGEPDLDRGNGDRLVLLLDASRGAHDA